MRHPLIKVLLIEPEGETSIIDRCLSLHQTSLSFQLERAIGYETVLQQIVQQRYDLYLIDESLGAEECALLVQTLTRAHCFRPIVLLTEPALDRSRDLEVTDQLSKAELTASLLERSIRYAVEQARTQIELHHLRQSEERYALAAEGGNDGIWDWDLVTNQVYFSSRWKTVLGYREQDLRTAPEAWFQLIHPEDLHWFQHEIQAHLDEANPRFECVHRIRHQAGDYRWMLTRGLAIQNAQGQAIRLAGCQTDISAWKQAEEKLVHDALHDMLTGLPNRIFLMERLRQALHLTSRNPDYLFAVLFIDLDRFKVINDSLGHMIGDQLLVAIAQRLINGLRPSDTIARLGGDEFVILLTEVRDRDHTVMIADRLQRELSIPFTIEGHEIFSAASIGIAFGTPDYQQPEDLLRDADMAMYRAKAHGRARYAIFQPGMHSRAVALLQLETDLRRSIDRNELQLYYQPIVGLRTGQVTGFEALVRWSHPQRGMVSPSEFIPIAEETGLITPLGWWVLQEACRQLRQWQAKFPYQRPLTVNVNLSSKQFTPQLVEQTRQILEATQLPPQYLKLEITESLLMENAESAATMLTQLKQLGLQLAIDDFGTGYSSLNYLHRFPIDTLKIDRSFISRVDVDGEQLAIVRTIITLAWNLGMDVVAEGVETLKQLTQLRSLQCDYAQGFLFSQPLEASAVEQLMVESFGTPLSLVPSANPPKQEQAVNG
jgi:diguanylate cyclase (GGDEF)-like protein/PAS domain S-box-containing protein